MFVYGLPALKNKVNTAPWSDPFPVTITILENGDEPRLHLILAYTRRLEMDDLCVIHKYVAISSVPWK